jgi:hypothetical protein
MNTKSKAISRKDAKSQRKALSLVSFVKIKSKCFGLSLQLGVFARKPHYLWFWFIAISSLFSHPS